jgi:hypothetical protein
MSEFEWDQIDQVVDVYPPTYYENAKGQRWAVVGGKWYTAKPNITLEEIRAKWVKPSRPKSNIKDAIHSVKSSDGSKMYTVTVVNGIKSCNCTGFGFRRDCKHVRSITA